MVYSENMTILPVGGLGTFDAAQALLFRNPIKVKNTYYGFYQAQNAGGLNQIGLAISQDGVGFNKHPVNPVIPVGGAGSPDEHGAMFGAAIYVRNQWYVFYGALDGSDVYTIAWATGHTPESMEKKGIIVDAPAGFTVVPYMAVEFREYSTPFNVAPPDSRKSVNPILFLRYVLNETATSHADTRLATLKLW